MKRKRRTRSLGMGKRAADETNAEIPSSLVWNWIFTEFDWISLAANGVYRLSF